MPLRFASPVWLILCIFLVLLLIAAAWVRRPALPTLSKIFAVLGALLLALAAGEPRWNLPATGQVAVMVDMSPSTRTAQYRDRAALEARLGQLLGNVPHSTILFAAENHPDTGGPLMEIPAERTVFAPPACDAVLLLSDARFALPAAAPPTYVVIDPALDHTADAAVTHLEIRAGALTAAVVNGGSGARAVSFEGVRGNTGVVPPGARTLTRPLADGAAGASVRLAPGDPWPENDGLAIAALPPAFTQRWWITSSGLAAPDATWTLIAPGNPRLQDPAAYLSASVIAVANVPSADLPSAVQDRLAQYVRDLGGALLILGGDHAFSAGAYVGTRVEALAPLSSSPPTPQRQWLLLADSSGSMAQPSDAAGGATRWAMAGTALANLLSRLPPADMVSAGNFAAEVRWWSQGRSVRDTAASAPLDVQPGGPTNLEAALTALAEQAQGTLPTEVVVISDMETTLQHPDELADAFAARHMRLHLLVIGATDAPAALLHIVARTQGTVVKAAAQKWNAAAQELLGKITPAHWVEAPLPIPVIFIDEPRLTDCRTGGWDQTWLKPNATLVAHAAGDAGLPMAARWQMGTGQVLATAFTPTGAQAGALARVIAHAPRDPRWRVHWDCGPQLRVRIDATDASGYLNGEDFSLELGEQRTGVPQTGPGRYELALAAPREAVLATLWHEGQTIDRVSVPGRYAQEFEAVGNDHEAMDELAARTGGAVIDPRQTGPVDFRWSARSYPLTAWLACAATVLLAAGLWRWRAF